MGQILTIHGGDNRRLFWDDFFLSFRKAAVHVNPTALTTASAETYRHRPIYNNTAKHSSNSWTFNKTLSHLIRYFYRPPQLSPQGFTLRCRRAVIIGAYFLFSQEKHSEIPRPGERHLDSEGHAETGRYHPLCFWSPQYHKHLRKSLPSLANRIPHEKPALQALCHRGQLRDPSEQQLWAWDRLSWLCYQVAWVI